MSKTIRICCVMLLGILFLPGCSDQPETDNAPTAGPGSQPGAIAHPPGTVAPSLPNFTAIADVPTLKRRFYNYMYPLIVAENDRIRAERRHLEQLRALLLEEGDLPLSEQARVERISERYRLPIGGAAIDAKHLDHLLQRVDVVPPPLALSQAAIESGWGRSRFSRQGNNIFGEWCFEPGCGIVPKSRSKGARYEVARFKSPAESIRSYLHNLNSHPAYDSFRVTRRRQRRSEKSLDAHTLAGELTAYSTLREEYVRRLRSMMRQNAALIPNRTAPAD